MLTIWKFPLEVADLQTVHMPAGAEILCVQTQDGGPHLWALVDPDAAREPRVFATHGTGHEVLQVEMKRYIGTYQMRGGALVFHVFEVV